MAQKYFKNQFAVSGDKEAVPDDSVNTLVSYETGYTPEYELDPDTDPNGNYVGRQRFNQLFADVTGNLKQWQDKGYPEFVADDGTGNPLSYEAGRVVELSGVYYRANTTTNTAPPSAQWDEVTLADLIPPVLQDASETVKGIVELLTAAETIAGTDNTKAVHAAGLLAALNALTLGRGQTMQVLTGSRSADTAYQNVTGRAIQVFVRTNNSTSDIILQNSVDGSTWVDVYRSTALGGNIYMTTTVPPLHYYRVTNSFITWAELR